jgi:hypothetical protein
LRSYLYPVIGFLISRPCEYDEGPVYERETNFTPAGPYRNDFTELLAESNTNFDPAGPYRNDFTEVLYGDRAESSSLDLTGQILRMF